MAKQKVSITDNGIKSGVTSDEKRAICEYIWNGFDAKATCVELVYEYNELGYIQYFAIKDNGEGIRRDSLYLTFGKYQDSNKKRSFQWSSQIKGYKGKGRYSFDCFATRADWVSVYQNGDQLLKHHISIESEDMTHFNDHGEEGENLITHSCTTGTIVSFSNVKITREFFESDDFINYLKKEYAVFLKLNESSNKKILINGVPLDYRSIIADSDSKTIEIAEKDGSQKYTFEITFVRWKEKIRENYCSYFLDSNQIEHYEKTTTLNKKDTEFHHSVYVISSYFDAFVPSTTKESQMIQVEDLDAIQTIIDSDEFRGDKSEKDYIFKKLLESIKAWIIDKQKEYIQDVAGEELWSRFEKNGTVLLPKNDYEKPLYEDLKQTVKGIYAVRPNIFTNLRNDSAKALVGCVRLLLQTDKREDILVILESIVNMSDEERHRLKEILQKTEMSNITNTIAMLEDRLKIVSALKAMVFDKSLNAYEVEDVQKFVSSAFWLFGEQYNIITEAEPDFQQALERYLKQLQNIEPGKGKSKLTVDKLTNPDKNKEMDVFACRQTCNAQSIENIIVELKRPSVDLGELELSQIKTYMRTILSEPQFNSNKAQWTFILVGNELDKSGTIQAEYETNKQWGKKDLVMKISGLQQEYEIYVKTWGTIFDEFEIRHNFLLKRLNTKREKLSAVYNNKEDLHKIVEKAKQ